MMENVPREQLAENVPREQLAENVPREQLAENVPREQLAIGRLFASVDEVKDCIQKYNKENFTEYRVRTNNQRSLLFECKHGRHRDSRSKNIRPGGHFNFSGCQAKINFYKSQANGKTTIKLTNIHLEHTGHVVNEDVYNLHNTNLTDDDLNCIKSLKEANCKPSQIQQALLVNSKKRVTVQKVKNIAAKLCPPETDEESKDAFVKFLSEVELGGGIVDWESDPDGTIKTLFITSHKMKKAFRCINPPAVQLDTSFNFERAHYKVAAIAYLDPNTNKSEIAAFSMMS